MLPGRHQASKHADYLASGNLSADTSYPFDSPLNLLRLYQQSESKVAIDSSGEHRALSALKLLFKVIWPNLSRDEIDALSLSAVKLELDIEIDSSRPDLTTTSWLSKINQDLFFLSDFYHTSEFLHKLLATSYRLFASLVAGHRQSKNSNKRTGSIYPRLLKYLKEKPENIYHIGDNIHADVEQAKSHGIPTHLVCNPKEEKRREWYRTAFEAWTLGDATLYHQALLTCNPATDDEAVIFSNKIAPLFVGFALYIHEQALREGAGNVHFLTREGAFFKEVYDCTFAANPYHVSKVPTSHLLEVSRLSTLLQACRALTYQTSCVYGLNIANKRHRRSVASLGLPEQPLRRIFESKGLPWHSIIEHPWLNRGMQEVLSSEDAQQYLKDAIGAQKANLLAHLNKNNFCNANGQKVIVDIGWRGTIQDNLSG